MDSSQLVRALRQCDGANVQCLILVRDDFWMSTTRFMQALEIPQLEGITTRLQSTCSTRPTRGGSCGPLAWLTVDYPNTTCRPTSSGSWTRPCRTSRTKAK